MKRRAPLLWLRRPPASPPHHRLRKGRLQAVDVYFAFIGTLAKRFRLARQIGCVGTFSVFLAGKMSCSGRPSWLRIVAPLEARSLFVMLCPTQLV